MLNSIGQLNTEMEYVNIRIFENKLNAKLGSFAGVKCNENNTKGDVLPHSQTTQKRDENTMYNAEYFLTHFEVFRKGLKFVIYRL